MFRFFFTALAGLLVACTQNSSDPNASAPIAEVSETVNEQMITITRHGNPNGQTLIFIPGLASSKAVWDETISAFPSHDIRVVQVAGFAGAEAVSAPTIDGIQAALSQHLKQTPGKDTILIGHSLGGFLSLKMALADPELIDEVIVVDSLPYLAGMMMPGTSPEQAAQMAGAMSEQLAALPRAQFDMQQEMGLRRLVKDVSYLPEIERWSQASDQATVATLMGELLASDLRENLAELETKTTVLMAHDSVMGVPQETLKALYAEQYSAAPNVDIEVIANSYHFIMFDQPDDFKATLNRLINE